jgi:uncharacterized protein (TIGR03382 family)
MSLGPLVLSLQLHYAKVDATTVAHQEQVLDESSLRIDSGTVGSGYTSAWRGGFDTGSYETGGCSSVLSNNASYLGLGLLLLGMSFRRRPDRRGGHRRRNSRNWRAQQRARKRNSWSCSYVDDDSDTYTNSPSASSEETDDEDTYRTEDTADTESCTAHIPSDKLSDADTLQGRGWYDALPEVEEIGMLAVSTEQHIALPPPRVDYGGPTCGSDYDVPTSLERLRDWGAEPEMSGSRVSNGQALAFGLVLTGLVMGSVLAVTYGPSIYESFVQQYQTE